MVGVVEGFGGRYLEQRGRQSDAGVSIAAALLVLIGGTFYFRRMETTFR